RPIEPGGRVAQPAGPGQALVEGILRPDDEGMVQLLDDRLDGARQSVGVEERFLRIELLACLDDHAQMPGVTVQRLLLAVLEAEGAVAGIEAERFLDTHGHRAISCKRAATLCARTSLGSAALSTRTRNTSSPILCKIDGSSGVGQGR